MHIIHLLQVITLYTNVSEGRNCQPSWLSRTHIFLAQHRRPQDFKIFFGDLERITFSFHCNNYLHTNLETKFII